MGIEVGWGELDDKAVGQGQQKKKSLPHFIIIIRECVVVAVPILKKSQLVIFLALVRLNSLSWPTNSRERIKEMEASASMTWSIS